MRAAGTLVANMSGIAVLAASPPPIPVHLTCGSPELSSLPFCNRSLPVEARVADLLPRLNITNKIDQTKMVADAIPSLGMKQYNFGGEALHGVWSSCVVDNVTTATHVSTGKIVCATQFPAPVHMGCSFNRNLWRAMADATSTEARALYRNNMLRHGADGGFGAPCARSLEGCLGLSYYTPNVNIARDPRCVCCASVHYVALTFNAGGFVITLAIDCEHRQRPKIYMFTICVACLLPYVFAHTDGDELKRLQGKILP